MAKPLGGRPHAGHEPTGFSLLELLAVVVILGVIAALVVPRMSLHADDARAAACHTNKREVENQAHMYWFSNGDFPSASLTEIDNVNHFPDGLPTCPVNGTTYTIDTETGVVVGHNH